MVDVADADVVCVLTRAPSALGKTRLFAELGIPPDSALLQALLLDTLDGVRGSRARTVVAVTPSSAAAEIAALAPGVDVLAQPEGDLGIRMRDVMRQLFDGGASRVAIVGSDLPLITSAVVDAALDEIEHERRAIALGPSRDGGYYLVAASRVPPIFDNVAWGTGDVLEQTLKAASKHGHPVRLLTPLRDVDRAVDLEHVRLAAPRSRTARWRITRKE